MRLLRCRRRRSPPARTRTAGPLLLLAAGLLTCAPGASAQLRTEGSFAAAPAPAAAAGRSLVLPGWGQRSLGQRRAWVYLALEAGLWAYWGDRRAAGAEARSGYRDLAWSQARLASGSRQDGDWAYYETLEEWTRSGAFDADAARAGIQPEEDPTTFNGYVWSLARGQFLPGTGAPDENDPRYARALAYYEARAYGAAFLWDWSGKEGELVRYKALIRESDERFQHATNALGAVLANHLLSATDAFLSTRLPGDAGLRVAPGSRAGRRGWTLAMTLRPAR